jgi:hypothetical protein
LACAKKGLYGKSLTDILLSSFLVEVLNMRGINQLLGSLALAGMMMVSSVEAGAANMDVSSGDLCRVKVSRSASEGVFDVTRQVFNNGKCVCRVTTGPSSQGGSAESALAGLLLRRTCSDAPLASVIEHSGGLGTGALIGAAVLVGGGLAVALSTGGGKAKSP